MAVAAASVFILDAGGDLLGECEGPGVHGRCPRVLPGEVVPCASALIVPSPGEAHVYRLHVPTGSVECPLSWIVDWQM